MFISFLDNDLMILRNSFGAVEIVKRKEYVPVRALGAPSASDETGAPGV